MLWSVRTKYSDGQTTDELVYSEKPITIYPKRDKIVSAIVNRFKYEIEYHFHPCLFNSSNGKKYIVPMWKEVHPETTYDDITWIRPEPPKERKVSKKIEGSMGTYKTTYDPNKKTYKCTCMGFWRSKGNCKHVKSLKESLVK